MKQIQPRQNYLGPSGWVWAGKYKLERYLYLIHRITGLGILLFGIIYLTIIIIFHIQGRGVWETILALVHNPWFKIVATVFIYHALNGLRLVFQELGFVLGRPAPPIYPYQDSLRKKRPWTIAMVAAMVVILTLVFLFSFLVGGR